MKKSSWASLIASTFAGGALAWVQMNNVLPGPLGMAAGAVAAGLIAVVHLYQDSPTKEEVVK